jgi:hypothetical protein
MAGYPPEPWRLRGTMWTSVFVVPVDVLPREVSGDLPPPWSVVQVAGRALLAVIWADYRPGGTLSYHELMTALVVRRGLRLAVTVGAIWVDSGASRAGARALWGIPKELADFAWSADGDAHASDARGAIASSCLRAGPALPGRWPVAFSVVALRAGQAAVTPVRATAAIGLAGIDWKPGPDGPLAFLAGHRPRLSFVLADVRLRFGRRR